jgi:hypothetical protein
MAIQTVAILLSVVVVPVIHLVIRWMMKNIRVMMTCCTVIARMMKKVYDCLCVKILTALYVYMNKRLALTTHL